MATWAPIIMVSPASSVGSQATPRRVGTPATQSCWKPKTTVAELSVSRTPEAMANRRTQRPTSSEISTQNVPMPISAPTCCRASPK